MLKYKILYLKTCINRSSEALTLRSLQNKEYVRTELEPGWDDPMKTPLAGDASDSGLETSIFIIFEAS